MKPRNVGTRLAVWTFLGMLLLVPGQALAQDTNVEISAGYSYLQEGGVDGAEGLSVPAGWYASAGGYLNSWLGIVGEANGHYKATTESGVDVKTSLYIFGAGPKVAFRRNTGVTPYVQLLFGGGRSHASLAGFDATLTGFAFQPGAGLEINNSSRSLGLRVAVARASLRSEGEWFAENMFMAGVVFRR